jgi:hypothetical protein
MHIAKWMEWLYGALGNLGYLSVAIFFKKKKKEEEEEGEKGSCEKEIKIEKKLSQSKAAIVDTFL